MGDSDGGVLFVGDKGMLMCGCYGRNPQLIPEARMKEYKPPPRTLARIPGGRTDTRQDWVRACKGGKPASSNFDYLRPVVRDRAHGQLAVRYPEPRLLWDGEKMKVTNDTEANAYVRRQYRKGWTL